jgi:putative tryptophan/tyrosine transport system substrate-binding protein
VRRREFITILAGMAAWPLAARGQQPAMPVVGFVNAGSSDAPLAAAFRKGLNEVGYVEGQNVTVEYHWLEGQFDRLPALMADLVHRRVAAIATPAGNFAALAAKAATMVIPIIFGVGEDPVKLGLVTSLARPGGNLTGINFLANEVDVKRLALLHELLPKAVRIAVLVNPANIPATESTLRDIPYAARAIGLQIQVLNASTTNEIEAAFATVVRDRAEAMYVGYATDRVDMYRQVGAYTGQILKGTKPADLPVLQSTKFAIVINLTTAKALGLTVPPSLLARADEVIE